MAKKYEEIYPVCIVADRYSGCYSGGVFLAFNLNPDTLSAMDLDCDGSDNDAEYFWDKYRKTGEVYNAFNKEWVKMPIGLGASPNDALKNLSIKIVD